VLLVTLALLPVAGSNAALAGSVYSDLVVFGDSLSDNGNFYAMSGGMEPPSPPYYEGRYSNGPVWAEGLAGLLGLDPEAFSDLAVAGSTTEEVLTQQVSPFVAGGSVPSDALYVVWAGPSDFFGDLSDPSGLITAAMDNLSGTVGSLAGAGALDIMVPNMPNLGRMPAVLETGDDILIAAATVISMVFDEQLSLTIGALEADLGLDIIEVDTFGYLEQMVVDPASFGLSNVTERALSADGTIVPNPDEYLFWDEIHPTRVAHAFFADHAYAAIPEPATLLLVALGALALLHRRITK
jgi:outer membrane lipase/esterase